MTDSEYYTLEDIRGKVEEAISAKTKGVSMPSFYRQVVDGAIRKHPEDESKKRGIRYKAEDVESFLLGKAGLNTKRGASRIASQQRTTSQVQHFEVDIAYPEDTPAVYLMEYMQVDDLERAINPKLVESWLNKNNHVYTMLYDSRDRFRGVQAALGILPLQEELIMQLLQKKRSPQDITPSDVLTYSPGQSYSCYIVSASTLPRHHNAILQLMQYHLDYWCQNNIHVEKLYISAKVSLDDTPALQLISEYRFMELGGYSDEQAAWRLRFDLFNASKSIQAYQQCIQERKEVKSMTTATLTPPLKIEQELEGQIREKVRDLAHMAQFYVVEDDGRINSHRGEGLVGRDVWFKPISSDEDIRSTLRINASLFGSSKKFTEDQLVETRRLWVQKNPDVYRVLEVDGEVVGFIFAMPLPSSTINRLISGEIKVGDVPLEELQIYKPGGETFNVYLQTLGIHKMYQGMTKRTLGRYLISGMLSLINDFGKRGIKIGSMYTRSDEIDGINLSLALGFEKIPPPPGVEKFVFRLDFSRSDLPFLYEYRRGLAKYQRAHPVVYSDVR